MSNVKFNLQKSSKNIDWKSFFNMRIFRYSLVSQLKSISTYVFFGLTIILSGLFLLQCFTWGELNIEEKFDNLTDERLTQLAKIPVLYYKVFLYIFYILIFAFFITFKSLQIFRDEMDDGTLLVISSMSFSRFKLIIQKWFSLQIVCLIFTLSIIFVSPVIFLLIKGFSKPSLEITKVLYENSLSMSSASIIFQILVSTIAIVISLYLNKVATIGILSLFDATSIVMFLVPMIAQSVILKEGAASEMNKKIQQLGLKNEPNSLLKYYNDADLKNIFEIENWYKDQWTMIQNRDKWFKLTFEPETLKELSQLYVNIDKNNDQQNLRSLLKINVRAKIEASSDMPTAIKEIFDLFRPASTIINFQPIKVNNFKDFKVNKSERNLINLVDTYKTALDNNVNFTQKEKKIVQLSKEIIENSIQKNKKDTNFVDLKDDTDMLINCFANLLSSSLADNYVWKERITRILENKDGNKSVAYFIDNPAFQNLNFFLQNFYKEIVSQMYVISNVDRKSEDIMKDKEAYEKYFKFVKINNYLNIMTQIAFIWNSQLDNLGDSVLHGHLLNNYSGEWEQKSLKFKKEDNTFETNEALKLKPESFKKIINLNLLYIIYPLISLGLAVMFIFMVYKKDFV